MRPTLADPIRTAEITLAASIRSQCDAVFFEPSAENPALYAITFERDHAPVKTLTIEGMIGAATIARLAYLGGLDLASPHATSSIMRVRSGDQEADVVITLRPGDGLRADLMIVPREAAHQQAAHVMTSCDVGDIIGNYQILEQLGEGGMGTVFSVRHIVLERAYALKVLLSRVFERDPPAAQQFVREARAAARIRHPNIVDVFDFGYLGDGRPYFVMELLEGRSIADHIAKGALHPQLAVAVARQLADALAAAHDHGVVHGDVTPSNALVMAGDPPKVKLVDFGLSAIVGEANYREDDPSCVFGTPAYISPEQLRALQATDRSDQYSLGCVIFEMLAGHTPFVNRSVRDLCLMHLGSPVPTVTSPHGPLPSQLVDIVTTCLQKSPLARFPSMRALVAALEEVQLVTERPGWQKWLNR
jgi:serine/threonine protein kinase